MPQKRVKSTGAKVLKSLINATRDIERELGTVETGITVKSSADFTDLKTLTKKFPKATRTAHIETLKFLGEELELALSIAMESKVWQNNDWPYGDGDIVQFGNLRDSLKIETNEEEIRISYMEEYAAIVHFGGYIHLYGNIHSRVYMPARPWIKSVLLGGGPVDKFDFTGLYRKKFDSLMKQLLKDEVVE